MSDYVDVCALGDIPEGELKGVRVGGVPVVIGNVGGKLAALGGVCSHEDELLEEGELDGHVVRCPLHDSGFDIHTGKATRLPATKGVPVYDVRVEGSRVLVSRHPRAI
jgi:3-phenylpropionate/trans-cinnamate dioxygenase ferredoxin component